MVYNPNQEDVDIDSECEWPKILFELMIASVVQALATLVTIVHMWPTQINLSALECSFTTGNNCHPFFAGLGWRWCR